MYNILNNPQLGELEIIEVYEYFNMPLLFSCKNSVGSFYIALCADDLPEHDMWLYTEVSLKRLNLIRSALDSVYNAFAQPEMGRLLKVTIPHNNSATFNSDYVTPSELDENVFPPISKYVVPKETPLVSPTSIVEVAKLLGREIIRFNFKSIEGYNAEAPIAQLGSVLNCFQNVMDIIEVARQNFRNITPAIRERMRFYALATEPGSFEIKLASKKEDMSQQKWLDLPSEQEATITQFFNLVKSKDNRQDLKGILTELGLRTTNGYRYLLASLNKLDADVTMSWTSPKANEDVVASLSRSEIPQLVEILKSIEEEQAKPQTIKGELIGLSLDRNRFELQVNGEENPIRGVIGDNPNVNITQATISSQYKALIQEIVKRNETTNEVVKIEHILLNLEKVTQD